MLQRPQAEEYALLYAGYVDRVPESDVLEVLASQGEEVAGLLGRVSPEGERHRYAPGKWSVREVVGHLIDSERVFAYRALSFARADPAPLPGFDEQAWLPQAGFDRIPLADLVEEFVLARASHLRMLRRLSPTAWARRGVANQNPITVRALAWVMAGHVRHHLAILRDRYGVGA
jgi:hypothetical protein